MTDNKQLSLPINDGFDVVEKNTSGSRLVGRVLKFNAKDGLYYVDDNRHPFGGRYGVRGLVTSWVRWENGKPTEHRDTPPGGYHPDRSELPDLEKADWPLSKLTGEPSDPWEDSRYLYLIDSNTAASFTFCTSTTGGKIAIGDLKMAINDYRNGGYKSATPIIALASTNMRTKYGHTPRPEFKVLEWIRGREASQTDLSPADEAAMIAAYVADGGVIG